MPLSRKINSKQFETNGLLANTYLSVKRFPGYFDIFANAKKVLHCAAATKIPQACFSNVKSYLYTYVKHRCSSTVGKLIELVARIPTNCGTYFKENNPTKLELFEFFLNFQIMTTPE